MCVGQICNNLYDHCSDFLFFCIFFSCQGDCYISLNNPSRNGATFLSLGWLLYNSVYICRVIVVLLFHCCYLHTELSWFLQHWRHYVNMILNGHFVLLLWCRFLYYWRKESDINLRSHMQNCWLIENVQVGQKCSSKM